MRKLTVICMILLFLAVSRQILVAQNKNGLPPNNSPLTVEEGTNPDFLDSLCFLPVKFTGQKDGILKAEFPSKNVAFMLDLQFLPDGRGQFFQLGQNSEEQISRDQFLKKFKKDFWTIVYRPVGENNFIYEAHQIKDLSNLQPLYAYDPYDNYQRVENYPFWQAIKLTIVQIHYFDKSNNKFSWVFIKSINKERDPAIYNELLALRNNYDQAIQKLRLQNPDAPIAVVDVSKELGLPADKIFINLDHAGVNPRILRTGMDISLIMRQDTFKLSASSSGKPNCVFSVILSNGQERVVDVNFFESNFDKYSWVVYYNPESKVVLRMVALSSELPKAPK